MKNPRWWFPPAVAIGSAVITLYAVEAVLSLAPRDIADRIGITLLKGPSVVSEAWRLRQRGLRAYPYLQSDLFTSDSRAGLRLADGSVVIPLSGIPDVLTVLCNESRKTIGYRSDSLGFRNPQNVWEPIHPEMFIIGDSFAHGFCRTERESIAGRLRNSGSLVANAGFTGAGPLAELGVIREYATRVKPKRVFWLFYEGNDLIDLESEQTTMLSKYLQPGFSQHLEERSKSIVAAQLQYADSVLDRYRPPGKAASIRGFVTMRNLRTASGLFRGAKQRGFRNETRELELFAKILAVANAEVRGWGGELLLVYLPERRRFNSRLMPTVGENHDPIAIERAVSRITGELKIPMLNAAAEFGKVQDPAGLWNARRYHYNSAGYEIVSELIARAAVGDQSRNKYQTLRGR